MNVVFIAAMIVGLALAVRVMVSGVLRAAPMPPPSVLPVARVGFGEPVVAAAATAFGIVGAVLTRATTLGVAARAGIAVAAALSVAAAIVFIGRWAAAAGATAAADDRRYALQGLPARVTLSLGGDAAGEVEYHVDGIRCVTPALSLDAIPIAVGAEVVIERIDGGVAWVEAWERVEHRM